MYPFYLGIDLHLKRTYLVLMNGEGEVIDKQRLKNAEIASYISKNVPKETYAVMEATRNWPFFYDLLDKHVDRVELAHAKGVRMIAEAAVKTDQIDASVLAHLARLNFLPIAYAAPKEIRDLRQHLRYRDWLIDERRRAKNRVHAVLAGYNLASPVTDLFGRAGREWLQEVVEEKLRFSSKKVVFETLEMINQLDIQIKELAKDIPLPEELEPKAELLMSMPGIGKLNSAVILAEIGDINRFSSPKALCNWAGLTPRVHKSDEVVRHGRISKQGSRYLRTAMVSAAMTACRISPRWYGVYEHLSRRIGRRGAKVAVGRRLLTVVYYMLKRDQPYEEDYEQRRSVEQGA
ncbi:MAG: IS110 family transposase [Anaerolineaceae bacterium]|nr:IS110 family transposase [Anaerolineaceae bacterium]